MDLSRGLEFFPVNERAGMIAGFLARLAEGGELSLSRTSSLPALYLPLRRVHVADTSHRRGT